jgi:hypothetical protein
MRLGLASWLGKALAIAVTVADDGAYLRKNDGTS